MLIYREEITDNRGKFTMLELKAVSNVGDKRTITAAIRSHYSDIDHVIRITIDAGTVSIVPDLNDLQWHLDIDREQLKESMQDLIQEWGKQ